MPVMAGVLGKKLRLSGGGAVTSQDILDRHADLLRFKFLTTAWKDIAVLTT